MRDLFSSHPFFTCQSRAAENATSTIGVDDATDATADADEMTGVRDTTSTFPG